MYSWLPEGQTGWVSHAQRPNRSSRAGGERPAGGSARRRTDRAARVGPTGVVRASAAAAGRGLSRGDATLGERVGEGRRGAPGVRDAHARARVRAKINAPLPAPLQIRLDRDDDAEWPEQAARPYDTPITDWDLPARECEALRRLGVDRVVASPFRRCIETASVVAATLGVKRVDVDVDFGEARPAARAIASLPPPAPDPALVSRAALR